MSRSAMPTIRCTAGRRGHTLIEMTLSLVLLAIISASIGSAIMFAARANPGEGSIEVTLAEDSFTIDRIAEELSVAQYIIETGSHAISFVVEDRTGDGAPDRLRYAWSGTAGEPLYYQVNDQAPIILIDQVDAFDLTYETRSATQTLPGALQRNGAEKLLAYETSALGYGYTLNATRAAGQRFTPSLGADVVAYEPTQLSFVAQQNGSASGSLPVQIRDASGEAPTGDAYASTVVEESSLPYVAAWTQVTFDDAAWVPVNEEKMISFDHAMGSGNLGTIYFKTTSTPFSYSTDNSATWQSSGYGSLLYVLTGYEIVQGYDIDVTRTHYSAVNISLQGTSVDREPLSRRVPLHQTPRQDDAFAYANFSSVPTELDLNADGTADWSYESGTFPDSALADGQWKSSADLIFDSTQISTADVITVTARMLSNDTLGPTIYGPYTFDASLQLLPVAVQLREDGVGGQELAVYNDTTLTTELTVIGGLPEGWVDIEVTLLPGEDYVCVRANHEYVGAFALERIADPGTIDESVRIGSSGGVGEITDLRVSVGGTYTVTTDIGGAIDLTTLLDLLGL